jgi:hypothetical protein
VRGAAKSESTVVIAENFSQGTTADDIEAVMYEIGGAMHSCRLIQLNPIMAEMTFVERHGAEKVIETFDGKKVSHTVANMILYIESC